MKFDKSGLKGLGHVVRFTLDQQIKLKTNRVTWIVLLIIAIVMAAVPSVKNFFTGNSEGVYEEAEVTAIYVDNRSGLSLPMPFTGDAFEAVAQYEHAEEPGDTELLFTVTDGEEGPEVTVTRSETSELPNWAVYHMTDAFNQKLRKAVLLASGVPEERAALLTADATAEVFGDTSDASLSDEAQEATMQGQLFFSIVMMCISMFSAGYIINIVGEEKVSKLIDLVMTGLKAPALLLGKVFGILLFIVIMYGSVAAAYIAAGGAAALIGGKNPLSGMAAMLSGIGAAEVVVGLISMLLGILIIALLCAMLGASCSGVDDTQNAMGTPMIIIMGAYLISALSPAFTGNLTVLRIFSVLPMLSAFLAPVQFAMGNISIWLVLAGWAIEAVVIVLLAGVCSRVYTLLLVYRGKTLKLSQIFKMAQMQSERRER